DPSTPLPSPSRAPAHAPPAPRALFPCPARPFPAGRTSAAKAPRRWQVARHAPCDPCPRLPRNEPKVKAPPLSSPNQDCASASCSVRSAEAQVQPSSTPPFFDCFFCECAAFRSVGAETSRGGRTLKAEGLQRRLSP